MPQNDIPNSRRSPMEHESCLPDTLQVRLRNLSAVLNWGEPVTPSTMSLEPLEEAADRITALEAEVARMKAALDVSMLMHTPHMPGDSRAVPDWFVACAAVSCGLDDDDGRTAECLSAALAQGEQP